MTEQQISELLREIYGFLMNHGVVKDWAEVERRIDAAAKRIAALAAPPRAN